MRAHIITVATAAVLLSACGGGGVGVTGGAAPTDGGARTATAATIASPSGTGVPAGKVEAWAAGSDSIPQLQAPVDLAGTYVAGWDMSLTIQGFGQIPEVSTADGDIKSSDTFKLLAVRYNGDGHLTDPNASNSDRTMNSISLIADGARTVLDPAAFNLNGSVSATVIAVPANAVQVGLEFASNDVVQTVSLTTGQLDPETSPALWYRDGVEPSSTGQPTLTVDVVQRLTFPFELEGRYPLPYGKYSTVVDVDKATLAYALHKNGTWIYPKTPGDAFLTLATQVDDGAAWYTVLPASSFMLTTADGRKVTPKRIDAPVSYGGGVDMGYSLFGGTLYWEVPANLATATITMKLGKNHYMGGLMKSSVLNYRGVSRTVTVTFPTS